jgi:hypothetical protein
MNKAIQNLLNALKAIGTIAPRKPGDKFIRVTNLRQGVFVDTALLNTLAVAVSPTWNATHSVGKSTPDGRSTYPPAVFVGPANAMTDEEFTSLCEELA